MTDVICDLDGVIYRGNTEIPGAGEALTRLEQAGIGIIFVTNNSAKTPADVADKITRLTSFDAKPEQVINSAVAVVSMLEDDDSPVLVVGERGIYDALENRGVGVTADPTKARCVIVGISREFSYELLAASSAAVRGGARLIATNTDPTFPTADGLLPGAGSIVAAVATASLAVPEVAGKPHAAIRKLIEAQAGEEVWVIGDRLDTDIALADGAAGWRSILVLTGVSLPDDEGPRPDHVATDITEAVELVLASRGG